MNELPRILLLLALAGAATTFIGSLALWWLDETRRIRRALTRVLKAPPEAMITARGRGRGAGFSFTSGLCAVAWDSGAWCLIYRLDELTGAELLVDGQVIARAARGEPRRALDRVEQVAAQVTLRLLFDDPRHPDFALDLYLAGDEAHRVPLLPKDAIQEGNRWLARAEAILRRPAAPRGPSPITQPEAAPQPRPRPQSQSQFQPAPEPIFTDGPLFDSEPSEDAPEATFAPTETPAPTPRARKRRDEIEDDQDDLPF